MATKRRIYAIDSDKRVKNKSKEQLEKEKEEKDK
jgi:hypothetical protein